MSGGHSASDEQNGHTLIGSRVSTKKSDSALSGGAMNPAIVTLLPASARALSENVRPVTLQVP